MTPRAVFDCNVPLAAARDVYGPAGGAVAAALTGRAVMCVSDDTVAEFADVAARPELRARFARLTAEVVADFLELVDYAAVRFAAVPRVATLPGDPKDEQYLALAAAAGAVFVVSRDNHLLQFLRSGSMEAEAFRAA